MSTGLRRKHTDGTKAEVARLRREERLSCIEIQTRMRPTSISFTTICGWLKDDPLTAEEAAARRSRSMAKTRTRRMLAGEIVGGAEWSELEDKVLERLWYAAPWSALLEALPMRSRGAIGKRADNKGFSRSSDARRSRPSRDPVFQALREIRQSRRITVEELADRIGMHKIHLTRCEISQDRPSWLMLRAWADALDCDIQIVER